MGLAGSFWNGPQRSRLQESPSQVQAGPGDRLLRPERTVMTGVTFQDGRTVPPQN